jgi:hypothetical protein
VKIVITLEDLKRAGIVANEQSRGVFRIIKDREKVIYFSIGGKWQYLGKVFEGDLETLRNWLKRHHFL